MDEAPPAIGDPNRLDTFMRRVLGVREPAIRRSQIERHLRTVEEHVAALHLETILSRSVRGDAEALEVTLTLAETLDILRPDTDLRIEALNLIAREEGLDGLSWFLLDPAPSRSVPEQKSASMTASIPLGVRRASASGWRIDQLERLLSDTDPMVIERLCANPRILHHHVLTIVTRRPTYPDSLRTVAREPRWFRDRDIRFALASNPYGPTGLSLRILPTLDEQSLQRIALAQDIHSSLRLAARFWLNVRAGEPELGPTPEALDPLHS